jgi:hypothetical protein
MSARIDLTCYGNSLGHLQITPQSIIGFTNSFYLEPAQHKQDYCFICTNRLSFIHVLN